MIALQGICYDLKSSFQNGPASAPPLIREHYYSAGHGKIGENGLDTESDLIIDYGDPEIVDYFDIEKHSLNALQKCNKILSLGGDHSISYPILSALHSRYKDLTVVVIDAHPDLYHIYDNDPHSHACPFARIMELGLAKELNQFGIRAWNQHQRDQAKKFGVNIFEMKDHRNWEIPKVEGPCYVSIDLDGFDPAFAPGVSHQEPGGMSTRQVLDIIHAIKGPIVGADIVEYNPRFDVNGQTGYLCAKLLKEILSSMLDN